MGCALIMSKMRGMVPRVDNVAERYRQKISTIARSNENEIKLEVFLYGLSMHAITTVTFGLDVNNLVFLKLLKLIPFLSFPRGQRACFFAKSQDRSNK